MLVSIQVVPVCRSPACLSTFLTITFVQLHADSICHIHLEITTEQSAIKYVSKVHQFVTHQLILKSQENWLSVSGIKKNANALKTRMYIEEAS